MSLLAGLEPIRGSRWLTLLATVCLIGCDTGPTKFVTVTCGPGTLLDLDARACVLADGPTPDPSCAPGEARMADGDCGPSLALECGPGTQVSADENVCERSEGPIRCGVGTSVGLEGDCLPEPVALRVSAVPIDLSADLRVGLGRAELGPGGVLHLHDLDANRIVRIDLANATRLPDIEGNLTLRSFAIDPDSGDCFLGYAEGRIEVVRAQDPERELFAILDGALSSLFATERGLFTDDTSDRMALRDYADASVLSRAELNVTRTSPIAALDDTVVFTRDRRLWKLDISRDPMVLSEARNHYGNLLLYPATVLPERRAMLFGDGRFYDFDSLDQIGNIGLQFREATLHNGHLHMIRREVGVGLVTSLDERFEFAGEVQIEGNPRRIFTVGDALFVLTERENETFALLKVELPLQD
ncbi:MAG: hypothetical protein ACI9U2_004833 [Bradymonadia bacterium]|jgi:hypothetical protein